MAYSYNDYIGDGDLQNFSVTFPYLASTDVLVYVDGIQKAADVHFTWLNSSVIHFLTAPEDGTDIRIERRTSRDARLVDFVTGSLLREADLDLDSNQLFYLMQEAFDWIVKASAESSAVFVEQDAIKDALLGQLDKSHLVGDLRNAAYFWEQEYLYDSIFVLEDEIYAGDIWAVGSARFAVVEQTTDNLEAMITLAIGDIEGNTGEIDLLTNEFMVKLDSNGYVTGFGLYNDGEVSSFIVNADYFGVIKADGTGTVKTPFIVDSVTGNIAIDGNLMVQGSITSNKISVTTLDAFTANLGTVTAGKAQSADGKLLLDLTNKFLKVFDGSDVLRVQLGYFA